MSMVRAFIALPIPSAIREELAVIQAKLIESRADVKWDSPSKMHITLKFLGDVDSSVPPLIAAELKESIGGLASFELTYMSIGGFPNIDRPRVVWIGAQHNEQVLELQQSVEKVCVRFGFAKEDRPFHAHITLGRVKGTRNLDRLTATAKSITFEPLHARCTEVHIVRSELKPSGSVYSLLNSIPLAP